MADQNRMIKLTEVDGFLAFRAVGHLDNCEKLNELNLTHIYTKSGRVIRFNQVRNNQHVQATEN